MFFQGYRYRDLPEISFMNKKGNMCKSKTIRPIPDVSGDFLHTVKKIDRLDLLSYSYYRDSQKWWHICDANPAFDDPGELVENFPMIREIYTVSPHREENRWALLVSKMAQVRGINKIKADVFENQLDVIYNQLVVQGKMIKEIIGSEGFDIGDIVRMERTGNKIIIPQNRIV